MSVSEKCKNLSGLLFTLRSIHRLCEKSVLQADPHLLLTNGDPDADLDPAIFVSDLSKFFAYYFLKVKVPHLHNFLKIKSREEVTKQ